MHNRAVQECCCFFVVVFFATGRDEVQGGGGRKGEPGHEESVTQQPGWSKRVKPGGRRVEFG